MKQPSLQKTFKPKGFEFFSRSRNQMMILISDPDSEWNGWLAYQHPGGAWVSLRKASEDDLEEIEWATIDQGIPPQEWP